MFGNGFAEGRTHLGIFHTSFQTSTDDASRAGSHRIASAVERCHGDFESLALFADAVFDRHFYVCKRNPTRCPGAHTELAMDVARLDSVAVQIHNKRR